MRVHIYGSTPYIMSCNNHKTLRVVEKLTHVLRMRSEYIIAHNKTKHTHTHVPNTLTRSLSLLVPLKDEDFRERPVAFSKVSSHKLINSNVQLDIYMVLCTRPYIVQACVPVYVCFCM